jgi:hypothetical protein
VNARIRAVFEILKLTSLLTIYDTRDEALKALQEV